MPKNEREPERECGGGEIEDHHYVPFVDTVSEDPSDRSGQDHRNERARGHDPEQRGRSGLVEKI